MAIISLAILAISATITPASQYRNLKVLPQNIGEKQLDSVMHAFNKALKVSCDFCHVPPTKDLAGIKPANDELDFALDNEMKENARSMLRMTIDINKKYFNFDSTSKEAYQMNEVSCNTCHRGNPFPANE